MKICQMKIREGGEIFGFQAMPVAIGAFMWTRYSAVASAFRANWLA
jgi:hypothetical protein